MSTAPPAARRRTRARVEGTVQGVGFRPYVYRLAGELGLDGFVLNDELGVLAEIEGSPEAVGIFLERLAAEAPPLAVVERVTAQEVEPIGEPGFEILASRAGGEPDAPVSPDAATCADCLAELFDPADRRFRYPFTNCTNCGPRFTIVRGVPYDRPLTTMAGFEMCALCRAEYEDPLDRRFHAQPNACADCGPHAWLVESGGAGWGLPGGVQEGAGPDGEPEARSREAAIGPGADAVAAAAAALRAGRIVAIKGIGGFHLACRADDEDAVATLRSRKHRDDKPFALMAPDLDVARALVELDDREIALLTGRERPIVIARRRADPPAIAPSVAPGSPDLGVMLPYSPLHHLLLADAGITLVMTSGNLSDEPIAYRDDEASARLAGIADLLLLHDRPIETRTDDSVLRALAPEAGAAGKQRGPLMMRRSRGYVPDSLELPLEAPRPLLACGAELKNTFCLAKGRRAWVGHHIGDLKNFETLTSFREGIEHFQRLFAVEPEVVAHDLHPEYLSTKYAIEREGVVRIAVQHHHAHLAACLAEHSEHGPAVGAIYDGTGYGPDGTVWGGEILVGGIRGYERAGLLWPVRLPGGEAAIREPWRMACAWLVVADCEERPEVPPALRSEVPPQRWREVCELVRTGLNSPPTTSAGRLFDAVAALCGVRPRVNYEGQAAVELEAVADRGERGSYELPLIQARRERPGALGGASDQAVAGSAGVDGLPIDSSAGGDRSAIDGSAGVDGLGGAVLLDARELIRAVCDDLAAGVPVATISARFHSALAGGTARACAEEAERRGLDLVVLSGGVFQNRLLLERTLEDLVSRGLRVLIPERLPPNDGGIAFGQAAIAAASRSATVAG